MELQALAIRVRRLFDRAFVTASDHNNLATCAWRWAFLLHN
jgi:hypothetical protein